MDEMVSRWCTPMNDHLSDHDIADWLAARDMGVEHEAIVTRHVAECDACRNRIERADALLAIASSAMDSDSVHDDCPDALDLAGFLDGRLTVVSARRVRKHAARCLACSDVVRLAEGVDDEATVGLGKPRPNERHSLRTWLTGAAALAAAAVIAIVFFMARPPVVKMNVRVLASNATRSATMQPNPSEFEVGVSLSEPSWITVLIVDSNGDLAFLEERHVDSKWTFGRYGILQPDTDARSPRRRYAIILVSTSPLAERLAAVDVDRVVIGEDFIANDEALKDVCARLATQLNCDARFAAIESARAGD